jgi:hypothetical protein
VISVRTLKNETWMYRTTVEVLRSWKAPPRTCGPTLVPVKSSILAALADRGPAWFVFDGGHGRVDLTHVSAGKRVTGFRFRREGGRLSLDEITVRQAPKNP